MTLTSATREEALWPGVHACRLAEPLLHGCEPLASNGKLWLGSFGLQRPLPPPARRHLLPSTLACAVWLLVAALLPCSLLALSSQKASFCIASLTGSKAFFTIDTTRLGKTGGTIREAVGGSGRAALLLIGSWHESLCLTLDISTLKKLHFLSTGLLTMDINRAVHCVGCVSVLGGCFPSRQRAKSSRVKDSYHWSRPPRRTNFGFSCSSAL